MDAHVRLLNMRRTSIRMCFGGVLLVLQWDTTRYQLCGRIFCGWRAGPSANGFKKERVRGGNASLVPLEEGGNHHPGKNLICDNGEIMPSAPDTIPSSSRQQCGH